MILKWAGFKHAFTCAEVLLCFIFRFSLLFFPLSVVALSHSVSGCSRVKCGMLEQTCEIGLTFVVETTYRN